MTRRRALLMSGAGFALPLKAMSADPLEQALRGGSGPAGVLMFRHALAPGNFDPPGFRLGDCTTQRNLDDEGRRQAQQIGAWFAARQLRPTRVRSSPWCRCMDTARLAFGDQVEAWAALGSPRAGTEEVNAQSLKQLRAALAAALEQRTGFEVWVTHMFVFSAFLGEGARSGEAVRLGLSKDGAPRVVDRLTALAA
jgi:Histidine phosphatase superfamily (branch 1)